jgi:ABC-type polysaccharide/polyol phosphate transport system ATPase subunit
MKPVIEIKEISKKYKIKHQESPYLTIQDTLKSLINKQKITKEEFWALKEVSFCVKQGESIGIIGKNGAGKSTLLKILSKITPPTKGSITIRGKIASLLEVGTGFHPELTGRENVFLNGSILGLKRSEIINKFDEIVDFSGVEKFLDTPLKHYSSGMQLRLAFSVAAHLETDILVIDEILAVGDADFQKKCIGKMDEVNHLGKTILFVSHNLNILMSLCKRSVLLNNGQVQNISDTESIINEYTESSIKSSSSTISVTSFPVNSESWYPGTEIGVKISWEKYRFKPDWECDLACYTYDGVKVFAIQSQKIDGFLSKDPELNSITFFIENPELTDKPLRLDVGIRYKASLNYEVLETNCLTLEPAGHKLPAYKRHDVVVVPKVRIG